MATTSAATNGSTASQADEVAPRRDSSGGYASTEHSLDYLIERSESESERLNRQHYKLYKISNSELLDVDAFAGLKEIYEREKRPLVIADVATAYGRLTSSENSKLNQYLSKIHGFDISDAQFPPDAPPPLKLHVQNIVDPPLPEFRGRFDYVHVRLLLAGLMKDEWAPAVRNCADMLRPGGYLDWEEVNVAEVQGEPWHPAFDRLAAFMRSMMEFGGKSASPAASMPSHYKSAGLTILKEPYIYPLDDISQSTRMWLNINSLMVTSSFVKLISESEKRDQMLEAAGLQSTQDAEQMLEDAKTVIKERASNFNWPCYRVVGRKS